MSIFNFFKKALKSEKEPQKQTPKSNKTHKVATIKLPDYDINFEYLDMVKNKYVGHLFYGNTSIVPMNKRNDMKLFYDQCIKDGWLYETEGNESVVESFTKKDFTTILEENNLPINGTKPVLVERIASNLGADTFNKMGEIRDVIKLTALGKSKLKEYQTKISNQYDSFRQEVFNQFMEYKLSEACTNTVARRESYPFYEDDGSILSSYESILEECTIIRSNHDMLKKLGVPEEFHDEILCIMCEYNAFGGGFDYTKKIVKVYDGLEDLLKKSDLVINKGQPYTDFQYFIRGREVPKFD